MSRILILTFFFLGACGDAAKEDRNAKYLKASCQTDDDCAKDRICKKDEKGEGSCEVGERPASDKAAKQKAEYEARKAKEEAKKQTKPGEGRLEVRVCPFFKNTPEALGTVVARNLETKQEYLIHMAQVVPDGGVEDVFTFWSLPLGQYEVTTSYGVQIHGRPEVVKIKCHDKVKKDGCKDEVVRLIEVVPPEKLPPVQKDKDGNPIKKDCDWLAE